MGDNTVANVIKMADIARAAGVSSMTVSRAFRADASVNKQTRARILKTAEEMGYIFDERAASLSSMKSGFIAVTIPSINNPNFAATVDAMSSELAQTGLETLLGYDLYSAIEEERLVKQLLRRRPEAVVLTGGRHTEHTSTLLRRVGVPVIETWDLPANPIGYSVGFSNAQAMEMMVDHLVAQGRRKIAFIGGDFNADSRGFDRRNGFIHRMQHHALEHHRLIPIGGPSTVADGAHSMGVILEKYPDTDAVIGVFDYAAFGALTECQRRGIRVPDDIAIAGFGATEIAAHVFPSLTTIDPASQEIGRQAGLILKSLRENKAKQKTGATRIEITPVLKIGQSTA